MWTTIYSPVALKGILPDNHLRIWLLFVRACTILCTRIINKSDIQSANLYLKQFCLKFIDVYGHEHFTPNMHMHMHLEECCNDSIYGFWCFAFERYNGILGAYQTDKKNIESQLMNKFLQQQNVNCLSVPSEFKDLCSTLTKSFSEKGALKVDTLPTETAIKLYILSHYSLRSLPFENELHFASDNVKLLPKVYERVLTTNEVLHLKRIYSVIYPTYHLDHFSLFVQESNTATLFDQLFSSKKSRSPRNSVFLADWPTANTDSCKRVCQINCFIQHTVTMKIIEIQQILKAVHTFCHVSWFKNHQNCDWFGKSAIIVKNLQSLNVSMITYLYSVYYIHVPLVKYQWNSVKM